MALNKNWVYYMQEGIRNMFSRKKDIPNEDFECIPDGECWCKQEEFPQLPASSSKDICYSPEEIERLKDSQTP